MTRQPLRRRSTPWQTALLVTFALAGGAADVLAQEAEDEGELGWSGSTSFGFAATTGNSETSTLNFGFNVAYDTARWSHQLNGNAFRATGEDENTGQSNTTAERYQLAHQSNFQLNDRSYLFGRLNFDRDLFSGVRRQVSETVGYGRKLVLLDRHTLDSEIGFGAKQLRRDDGSELNEAILRGGLRYLWLIGENSQFSQNIFVEAGVENVFTETITELRTNVVGNISLALNYTLRHNTDVSPTAVRLDTFTTVSLRYDF